MGLVFVIARIARILKCSVSPERSSELPTAIIVQLFIILRLHEGHPVVSHFSVGDIRVNGSCFVLF